MMLNITCAGSNSTGSKNHDNSIARKWKELYMKCLEEHPDDSQKCDKFKRSYEAESEKEQRQGSESNNHSYY